MPDRLGDVARIKHILEAISDIGEFVHNITYDQFIGDKMRFQATLRELEIIGEASNKISIELRSKHPEIPWLKMIGL